MKLARFALAATAMLGLTMPVLAQGSAWPTRPIRIIVNYQPGGSTDNATRPYLPHLAAALGQQVVIENKGGAAGAIGLEAAAKSPPDGYTFVTTPVASPTIVPQARKVGFDPFKDLTPVSRFADYTVILTAHPSIGVNTVQELAALSKRKPGTLNLGGVGVGTLTQLITIMLNKEAGMDLAYVPYRGAGEALPDFLAGVVQTYLDPNAMPHVLAGKVKLLAVVDRMRLAEFPDVPMLSEIYPALDFVGWFGMYAPAGTPPEIVGRMSDAMNRISATPEMQAHMLKYAIRPVQSSPEQFAKDMKRDWDRYGTLIREANITLD
ncbi:MAG: Bug family tripartite tricarboxylate transporter substrate binding protein [Acetobacteraceae bacterium]